MNVSKLSAALQNLFLAIPMRLDSSFPCLPSAVYNVPKYIIDCCVCMRVLSGKRISGLQVLERILLSASKTTVQDNARHSRGWGTMLHTLLKIQLWRSFAAKPMCKVTMRHQNMPRSLSLSLSLNRCSLSWGFSDDEAATSYGRNKIKSY